MEGSPKGPVQLLQASLPTYIKRIIEQDKSETEGEGEKKIFDESAT